MWRHAAGGREDAGQPLDVGAQQVDHEAGRAEEAVGFRGCGDSIAERRRWLHMEFIADLGD